MSALNVIFVSFEKVTKDLKHVGRQRYDDGKRTRCNG